MLGFRNWLGLFRPQSVRQFSNFDPPDLFESKGSRWLYNDKLQRQRRRVVFNIDALLEVVTQAVPGAKRCLDIQRLGEGSFNRSFTITTDNNVKVVARLPFCTAGPRQTLIQSEVATMDFIRRRFKAPIPQVLAWSATDTNPVGAEYIIMEHCPGATVASQFRYFVVDGEPGNLARQLATLQLRMLKLPFSQFGSIYYKEHVSQELQKRPLYATSETEDDIAKEFRIGPSVDRLFYRSERVHLDIDRGPWPDAVSYFRAKIKCEMSWIREHGNSKGWSGSSQQGCKHSPEEHLATYRFLDRIADELIQSDPVLMAPTLNHPDLSGGNVILDGLKPTVLSGIIDWQGTCLRPGLEHFSLPGLFNIPVDGFRFIIMNVQEGRLGVAASLDRQKLTEDEKLLFEFEHRWASTILAYAKHILEESNSSVLEDAILRPSPVLRKLRRLIGYTPRSYEEGLILLRQRILAAFIEHYRLPGKDKSPYILESIVNDDEDAIARAKIPNQLIAGIMDHLSDKGIPSNTEGEVDEENYDRAREEMEAYLLHLATEAPGDTEEAVAALRREWPFKDGNWSTTAERCN